MKLMFHSIFQILPIYYESMHGQLLHSDQVINITLMIFRM